MTDLVARLFGIVVLRLGPQDLPAGSSPLTVAMLLYLLVTAVAMSVGQPPQQPVLVLALAMALPLLLARIVLTLRRLPQRWPQTVTALFGTSAVLTAISLPLAAVGGNGDPPLFTAMASLVVFVWSFAVNAHIWRHALNVSLPPGWRWPWYCSPSPCLTITTLAGPL
jgi:hypothetical protein